MLWGDKPYNSLNYFLKSKFGVKVVKVSLDGGFTCPNRDGTISTGGCIFCSGKGSGDFAQSCKKNISAQIQDGKLQTSSKWKSPKYIAYFQAFTNTYAPVEVLRQKYYEALSQPDIVGIAIATRPDCIDDDVLNLLNEISKKTYLWVELGLQSSNEETSQLINRGYKNSCFENTVKRLNSKNIDIVVHLILGLPYETENDIINSINYVSSFPIQGIKLQLLHVLKGTPLAKLYETKNFHILSKSEYINLIEKCILYLNPNIVVHRITGDGNKENLLEPVWSLNKRDVLNNIHKQLRLNGSYQGKLFKS